jgi:hypothetical protein
MHCPCCCTAKGGAGIGSLLTLGLAIFIATHSATVMEAITRFLIVTAIGVTGSLAILIPTTVRYLKANRCERLAPIGVYRAVIARERTSCGLPRTTVTASPVPVITSAPPRRTVSPAGQSHLGIGMGDASPRASRVRR